MLEMIWLQDLVLPNILFRINTSIKICLIINPVDINIFIKNKLIMIPKLLIKYIRLMIEQTNLVRTGFLKIMKT